MLAEGARHLVLMGRRDTPLPENEGAFRELLRVPAAAVRVLPGDVRRKQTSTGCWVSSVRNAAARRHPARGHGARGRRPARPDAAAMAERAGAQGRRRLAAPPPHRLRGPRLLRDVFLRRVHRGRPPGKATTPRPTPFSTPWRSIAAREDCLGYRCAGAPSTAPGMCHAIPTSNAIWNVWASTASVLGEALASWRSSGDRTGTGHCRPHGLG